MSLLIYSLLYLLHAGWCLDVSMGLGGTNLSWRRGGLFAQRVGLSLAAICLLWRKISCSSTPKERWRLSYYLLALPAFRVASSHLSAFAAHS